MKGLLQVLENKGYSCRSKRLARLCALYAPYQRGLLSYELMPLRELKLYATQRALPITPGQKVTLTSLKTQLEQADEGATFRLSELPPELRGLIFSYYFNSFVESDSPHLNCQPPITLVSRTIRQESLPLFYGCQNLGFDVFDLLRLPGSESISLSYSTRTRQLLQHTTAEQFGWIRYLSVSSKMSDCDVGLAIDLCNKRVPVEVFYHLCSARGFLPHTQECADHLLSELNTFVRAIAAREGACKLRKSDLNQLHETVRYILTQYKRRA